VSSYPPPDAPDTVTCIYEQLLTWTADAAAVSSEPRPREDADADGTGLAPASVTDDAEIQIVSSAEPRSDEIDEPGKHEDGPVCSTDPDLSSDDVSPCDQRLDANRPVPEELLDADTANEPECADEPVAEEIQDAEPTDKADEELRDAEPVDEADEELRDAEPVDEADEELRDAEPVDEAEEEIRDAKPTDEAHEEIRDAEPTDEAEEEIRDADTQPVDSAEPQHSAADIADEMLRAADADEPLADDDVPVSSEPGDPGDADNDGELVATAEPVSDAIDERSRLEDQTADDVSPYAAADQPSDADRPEDVRDADSQIFAGTEPTSDVMAENQTACIAEPCTDDASTYSADDQLCDADQPGDMSAYSTADPVCYAGQPEEVRDADSQIIASTEPTSDVMDEAHTACIAEPSTDDVSAYSTADQPCDADQPEELRHADVQPVVGTENVSPYAAADQPCDADDIPDDVRCGSSAEHRQDGTEPVAAGVDEDRTDDVSAYATADQPEDVDGLETADSGDDAIYRIECSRYKINKPHVCPLSISQFFIHKFVRIYHLIIENA